MKTKINSLISDNMPVNFLGNNFKSPNTASQQSPVFDSFEDEKQRLAEGYDDVVDELSAKWKIEYASAQIFPEAVANIHPEVRNFLLEFSRVSDYDEIAKQAGLDEKNRDALGQIVWRITQTKNWDNLENEVRAQFGAADSVKLVAQLLDQKIINKVKMFSEKPSLSQKKTEIPVVKNVKLSLAQALVQYPNLNEQAITNNPLQLQYSSNPVKPSIKNWISDYHSALGSGKHSTIDRGNYLFHSENGKRLTPGERQKISLLLKSLDEETLLEIDGDAQQIIFKFTVETPVQNNNFPAQQPITPVSPKTAYQSAPIKESAPEDVAQARIRQSLDFSKNVAPQKENEAQKFTFEDSNYAEQLRTRIKSGSVQSPIKEKNELPGQSEGNLRFSSAQELPAEKELTSQQRSVTLPTHSIRENQPEKDAQTWNSPDFRQHLVQEKKAEESLPEKEPIAPAVQNQVVKMPKVYSPYIISPAHHYLAGQAEAPAPSPQPGQNDPKVKGNMVDLS